MLAIDAYYSIERSVQFGLNVDLEDQVVETLNADSARSLLLDSHHRAIVRKWNEAHNVQQIRLPRITFCEHVQIIAVQVYCFVSAVIAELLSLIAVKILYPTSAISSYEDPAPNARNQSPVIMVHGYLSNPTIWAYLRTYIKGERPQYTTNFPFLSRGVAEDADLLSTTVLRSLQHRADKSIDLVAHSRGGLVAVFYAANLAARDGVTVKSITTIGTPHNGTPIARFGLISGASREITPESAFIAQHKENLSWLINAGVKYYNVASEYDEVVPYSSMVVGRTREDSLIMSDRAHIGLMFSKTVGEFLRAKLVEAPA